MPISRMEEMLKVKNNPIGITKNNLNAYAFSMLQNTVEWGGIGLKRAIRNEK